MEAKELNERIIEERKRRIKVYPCRNLRASNVGHPCGRYLCLLLTKWEEQDPITDVTQAIFDLGNKMEEYAIQKLKDIGLEVITPNGNFKIDTPYITGREDLRIKDENGDLIPVEVKGLAADEWARLNSVEDFFTSKRYYIREYPGQLYIYLWKYEKPYGFFCLVNKQTGEIKLIRVDFDWEFADKLLKRANMVYEAVSKGELLDGCDDESVCKFCNLKKTCGRSVVIPTDIETDGELEGLIEERKSLAEAAKKYEELYSQIKEKVGERPQVLTGNYLITRKETITHVKEKPAEDRVTVRYSIKELGK